LLKIWMSAAALTMFTTGALGADDLMANFYGNTLVATGGMADTHTVFNADHSFDMKAPAFDMEFKGTWAVKDGNLCRTYESPPPGVTNPLCTQLVARKVGDSWTEKVNGSSRTITLVKGIQ
jgi:hypothetical protein